MVADLIARFRDLAVPGAHAAGFTHHHPGSAHGHHVVFGFIIHGNEHGTLPAAIRLVEGLKAGAVAAAGPVTVMIGNPEAALEDVRFLEEDLNRVFTFDREATSHERRRAEVLRPVLDAADLFLDFHQTQTPTESAFWTFPWEDRFGAWARALAVAPVGLTRPAGQVFSAGTCCLDEYVRGRGKEGITVELGYKGADAAQADACFAACVRTLQIVDAVEGGTTTLEAEAASRPSLEWFTTTHKVPAAGVAHRLRPGLANWTRVTAGEELGAPGGPSIPAPADGVVLFPKYPKAGDPPPPELFRLGAPFAP